MKPTAPTQAPLDPALTRRDFLRTSSLGAAGAALAGNLPFILTSHAAPDTPVKVAIIGCGGRGKGAGKNVMEAAPNVEIVALADIFPDQVEAAQKVFAEVPIEHCFSGFDAYQKAIAVPGVNYVILTSPPGFRPMHFEAAVAAGKHVFMEKPVAVDAPGVRSVMATAELATRKKLCVGAGTQRRHQASYIETIQRIQGGEFGNVAYLRVFWNSGGAIWHRGERGNTEMEQQIRNWYHYVWLSGDHIVEQHLHNLDVGNWVMNAHPVKASALGGRHGLGAKSGHIYDHFAVDYEYANGVHMFSQCRQINGCEGNVSEMVHGTKGACDPSGRVEGRGAKRVKAAAGGPANPYVQEHTDLIAALRSGTPMNEGRQVAESTLTAILGRESAYCGKTLTWEEVLNSTFTYLPPKLEWGPAPKYEVAMPGKHKLT